MAERMMLNAARITNKTDMAKYMKAAFHLPEYFGGNLDALFDCLCEVETPTEIILDRDTVSAVCADRYAYRVLMVISRAAEENENLRILFRQR